uniref:Uncharacterized protein n=1 Tax=Kalanchoe fedtschenkoi TaxID=63787 RepID=A0A7N0ZTG8_KALFE
MHHSFGFGRQVISIIGKNKAKTGEEANMMQQDTRKGPWTEQEDFLLANVVGLFGDRRWDFVAKVSGLNRTGKSCRLRWLNYLHPGLKRGKMTSTEERIVLELHARWGNRWSRIARRLPGRTDNEIKNYWRTHMRKKAQERKRVNYLSITSSESYSSSSNHTQDSLSCSGKESFYDTGGLAAIAVTGKKQKEEEGERIKMDEIWNDIDISKDTITPLNDSYNQGLCTYSCAPLVSPIWEYCPDPLWRMDEDDSKMPPPSNDYFQTCCEAGTSTLKGP